MTHVPREKPKGDRYPNSSHNFLGPNGYQHIATNITLLTNKNPKPSMQNIMKGKWQNHA